MKSTGFIIALLFFCAVGYFYVKSDALKVPQNLPANAISFGEFATVKEEDPQAPKNLVIVGDIMLGRYVAEQISLRGSDWPFQKTTALLSAGSVLGNFEAAIPEEYEPTPNFGMTLSVSTKDLTGLVSSGITHLSLANNHSFDSGEEGYQNTLTQLRLRGFAVSGNPNLVSTSSLSYLQLGDRQLALININATYHYPDESEWLPVVSEAVRQSDLQMVYIHWGEEYELKHNEAQAEFAHSLVDAGIDLIVGTHPHVVQDIEKYGQSLIFYSLGNFVFDQYFSDDVQEGLTLRMEMVNSQLLTELIPVETETVLTQPREMSEDKKALFLADLAERSQADLVTQISDGLISLQF